MTRPGDRDGNRREFWDRHPGLVWSNRDAPDEAFIGAALRKGRFLELLDIAVEFSVEDLVRVWHAELAEGEMPASVVKRTGGILTILEKANGRSVTSRDK